MNGFLHICDSPRIEILTFKRSIVDAGFANEDIATIMDFYVFKSFAADTALGVPITDYGWSTNAGGELGMLKLEKLLLSAAGIDAMCCIRAKTIKDTLSAMGLSDSRICIEHPRIVLQQNHSLSIDENEKISLSSDESRIKCLFRHIRNAISHGGMYFFDNGNALLEDRTSASTKSAEILIPSRCLL